MKRALSLRNRLVVSAVFMAVFFTTSSFTFNPSVSAPLVGDPPQKKERRIKVIVKKDGKETKIDTTFNLPDEKMISFKVDSMLKKFDLAALDSSKFNVFFDHPGNRLRHFSRGKANLPGVEKLDIMIQDCDSGMRKPMRGIIHLDDNDEILSLGDMENEELLAPPPPPEPPYPPFMTNNQFGNNSSEFNSNDESIISYSKKDIGKGLEKITIIRKKRVEPWHDEDIIQDKDLPRDSKK
jgi:hypothetical protein